jgi:hypothetical protein
MGVVWWGRMSGLGWWRRGEFSFACSCSCSCVLGFGA